MMALRMLGRGAGLVAAGVMLPSLAHATTTYGSSGTTAPVVVSQVTQSASQQASSLLAGRISQAVSGAVGNIGSGGFSSGGGGGIGGGTPGGGGGLGTPGSGTPDSSNGPRSMVDGKSKAAGDNPSHFAVWANGSNTWVANDQAGVNFGGTIHTGIIGVDRMWTDRVLGGLAVGYENPDVHLKYNGGTFKGNNYAVTPYGAYIFNENFSVDATAGYTWVNYDTTRNDNAVTGSITGSRLSASADANFNTMINKWSLGSTLGYMWLLEKQDAYTETGVGAAANPANQVRLGQGRWTNKAGYLIQEGWGSLTPYASVRLEYDISHTPSGIADSQGTPTANDRFGTTFGMGVNASVGNSTTFNLEGTSTQFREHVTNYGVSGTVRIGF